MDYTLRKDALRKIELLDLATKLVEQEVSQTMLPRNAAYALAWKTLSRLVIRLEEEARLDGDRYILPLDFMRSLFLEFEPELEYNDRKKREEE